MNNLITNVKSLEIETLKNLESDDAIAILENVDEKNKNSILSLQ